MRIKPCRCPVCDQLPVELMLVVAGREPFRMECIEFEDGCMTISRGKEQFILPFTAVPKRHEDGDYIVRCQNQHAWFVKDEPAPPVRVGRDVLPIIVEANRG